MKFWKRLITGFLPTSTQPFQASNADADQSKEDWTTFKRYNGDGYWLVVFDRQLLKNNQIVSMSWCCIEYRFLQHQLHHRRFPKADVSELYYGFEDHLCSRLKEIGGRMAASQTGFGSRMVWFCAPSLLLEDTLTAEVNAFKSLSVVATHASFSQFETLRPTHLETQLAGNEQILLTMSENGDDGSMPRDVMHWAFGDSRKLNALATRLENEGYVMEELDGERLRFSRMSFVGLEQVHTETIRLNEICEQFDCSYDGWETPIAKPMVH